MMINKKIAVGVLMSLLIAQSCSANYIGLSVTVVPPRVVSSSVFAVNVTVVNVGDEDAHDVQLSLSLPDGFTSAPQPVGILRPNTPYFTTFDVSAGSSIGPGVYPFVLKTHYADANAYPFSTVSSNFILYKESTPDKMQVAVRDVNISASDEADRDLIVDIVNLDDKPHDVNVKLYVPDEIKSDSYTTSVEVAAQKSDSVTFHVRSSGALAGSSYATFASSEYDEGGLHYSAIGSGLIRVVSQVESGEDIASWTPMAVFALLVTFFIIYQIKGTKTAEKGG